MSGPRTSPTAAFPGAPGVPGGVKSAPAGPVSTSVVGNNDYLDGGVHDVPVDQVFPSPDAYGSHQDTWQRWQPAVSVEEPVVNDQPGHVSGGIRVQHPDAFFPGLGQGV
jgi:hypothetical protein